MGQEYEVISLHVQPLNSPLEKNLYRLFVLEPGVPQSHKQTVFVAVYHLLRGKGNIHQLLPQRSRQSPLQQGQKSFALILTEQSKGLVKLGNNLPVFVDAATANVGNAAPVRPKPAAQLRNFFLVHSSLFCIIKFGARHRKPIITHPFA